MARLRCEGWKRDRLLQWACTKEPRSTVKCNVRAAGLTSLQGAGLHFGPRSRQPSDGRTLTRGGPAPGLMPRWRESLSPPLKAAHENLGCPHRRHLSAQQLLNAICFWA